MAFALLSSHSWLVSPLLWLVLSCCIVVGGREVQVPGKAVAGIGGQWEVLQGGEGTETWEQLGGYICEYMTAVN